VSKTSQARVHLLEVEQTVETLRLSLQDHEAIRKPLSRVQELVSKVLRLDLERLDLETLSLEGTDIVALHVQKYPDHGQLEHCVEELGRIDPDRKCLFVILLPGQRLELVDEKTLNAIGYYKKSSRKRDDGK